MDLARLPKPIIGLAPMDGITDHPLRYIYSTVAKPDLVYTEFTNVEAISRGQPQVFEHLRYAGIERPVVGQLSGREPASFYQAVLILCFLGFDGIDINLGCPARTVVKSGGGAALIGEYTKVETIISACRRAIKDFQNGARLKDLKLKKRQLEKIKELIRFSQITQARLEGLHKPGLNSTDQIRPGLNSACNFQNTSLPFLSAKTRTGFKRQNRGWLKFLFAQQPDLLCLHGRTAGQGYGGRTDWDFITWANSKKGKTIFLGNGDIKNRAEALVRTKQSGVDGVLIGRGALGNPWIFKPGFGLPTRENRLNLLFKHLAYFQAVYPEKSILPLRKHFAWYCRGFKGAKKLRSKLVQAENEKQVKDIIAAYFKKSHLQFPN